MINPDILLAKWYPTEVLDNNEQTETEKVGKPIVVRKVSYKTTIFDKTTRTVRNQEQLVVETNVKSGIDFKVKDILKINNTRWKIDSIENQDPFARIKKTVRLTLKR